MLTYQIDSMKQTVAKLLYQRVPPRVVYIEQPMAEHLGVKFDAQAQVPEPAHRKLVEHLVPEGVKKVRKHSPLVEVKLEDLVARLKGAKGVDDNDQAGGADDRAAPDEKES